MVCECTLPTASPETPLSLGQAGRSTKPSVLLESPPWIGGTNDKHRKQEEKLSKRGISFPQGKASQALPFLPALLGRERAFCWATWPSTPPVPPLRSAFFPLPLHPCPPLSPCSKHRHCQALSSDKTVGLASKASRAATEASLGREAPAGDPQIIFWEMPESYHIFSGLQTTLSKQQSRDEMKGMGSICHKAAVGQAPSWDGGSRQLSLQRWDGKMHPLHRCPLLGRQTTCC